MSKNIILIDKRVQDYETIVAAVDTALAVGVVFDYFEDTFDALKARISALGLTNGTNQVSVGLIQHNSRAPMFSMLASAELAPVSLVAAQDPELERWTQFRDFIAWCKTEHSAAHFDMMACALYSDPDWKYVIDTLTAQTGVTVRASTDDTGAASLGGDWFLESHTGVNLKTVYFTEAIEEYRGVLYLSSLNNREYSTKGFATGSLYAWGDPLDGGNGGGTVESNCVAVYSIFQGIFLALQTTGRIVKWGRTFSEYNPPSTVTGANTGVIAVYSTDWAFVALKTDGSIVAWGNSTYGGSAPTTVTAANSGVVAVYTNQNAFSALKPDSSVVSWGELGDTAAPTSVTAANSGVVAIYSTGYAFAALKTDGSIVAWGYSAYGAGTVPSSVTDANSGVVAVYSNAVTFAALKSDGSIVAWSDGRYGGSAPSSVTDANSGVVAVYSISYTFAALKRDGSVVSWGDLSNVGTPPTTVTAANSGVVVVSGTWGAFAALKADGTVVAWGSSAAGGTAPSSVTAANSGVVAIYSAANGAFAALKSNGSVVAWGSSNSGGTTAPSSVTAANSGVVAVYSTGGAFAALKNDGTIVAWGHTDYNISINNGGVAPSNVTNAGSGVHSVWSNFNCFVALKTTATTFDLSMSYYTQFDRYDILRKKENRRRVNLTTLNNNVFTLSAAIDIQVINSKIPAGRILRIIVPTYVSSSYSITSTATIPSSSGNFIVACDEAEPVTISGSTYVNYGTFVYRREANNTYTKTTSATINGTSYTLYGGDGIASSGIVFLEVILEVSTFSSSTFAVETTKTFGDASFAIGTRPTSNSPGAITYSSSNTAVATIDASGNWITLVAAGDVSFNATQAQTAQYLSATKASNTLTVARGISNLSASSTFTVAETKIFGDASFAIVTRPTSNSTGAITYSSSNTNVATIDASGNWITLVAAGDVSFNAAQAQTAQYLSAIKASNTLTVARGTPTLSSSTFTVASSKTLLDASFAIVTRPTSNSNGAITYSSSNTSVATIDASGTWITIVSIGDASFNATQAQTAQYFSASKASNTLTVSKGTPTLAFESSPPATKSVIDAAFTVTATSASPGAITYTSSNIAFATVGLTTGLVTLKGIGTVTITAAQAETALYASTTATYSVEISSVGSTFAGQIISPETSFTGLNFSGALLVGTTLSGVSFSGATLTNVDFSGATITGTNFTNANISGATNLPAFSTAQKLQLLSNINNVAISEIQINTQLNGADINAILPTPIPAIATATFTLKVPTTLDASLNKVLTITSVDLSNNASVYIPLNANESVSINGTVFSFNGTNILDADSNPRTYLTVAGIPFKIYAGSVIALNILNVLNNVTFAGESSRSGMYNILSELFSPK
jgi:alpha-tubulin suppressor-like RCC1 family protein